jgi:hypothetical protein
MMHNKINNYRQGDNMPTSNSKTSEARTTVGVKQTTKDRLDKNRAPGQCYDGFLCQMVDLWEATNSASRNGKKNIARNK